MLSLCLVGDLSKELSGSVDRMTGPPFYSSLTGAEGFPDLDHDIHKSPPKAKVKCCRSLRRKEARLAERPSLNYAITRP